MPDAQGDDYAIGLVDDLAARFPGMHGRRIDDDDVGQLWQVRLQHPQHGWRLKERAGIGDLHPARRDNVKTRNA